MGYLGEIQQSEAIRFHLVLDTAPTGTPQIAIEKQGASILAADDMIQGASTLEWYYAYTTDVAATIGAYQVKYSAVVTGVTRFAYDDYNISIYSVDHVKAETALILTDTGNIEDKVDAVKAETVLILADTGSIEDKVDIVDTNVDTSLVNQTNIEGKVDIVDSNVDQLLLDVAAVPTVGEIDTELSGNHGAGQWGGAIGTGAYNATINVKDDSANNVADAYVTVHNSNDDDTPINAAGTTDAQGNVTLNVDGTVYIRVSKVGFTFISTQKNVTASGTYNVTGTLVQYSEPSDPDLCRLFIYPVDLSGQELATGDLSIIIKSEDALTKINGEFIRNTEMPFVFNDATTPNSWYFDAVQGTSVDIFSHKLGIEKTVTVPALTTKDLYDLILET